MWLQSHLSVLFFPGWRTAFVLWAVPRNGIWTFGKTICHGRHIFFFPRMKVTNVKRFLIGQNYKPITTLILFVEGFTQCAWRRVGDKQTWRLRRSSLCEIFGKNFPFQNSRLERPRSRIYLFYFLVYEVCCKCWQKIFYEQI